LCESICDNRCLFSRSKFIKSGSVSTELFQQLYLFSDTVHMYGSIHTQESRDKRQSDAGQVILCTHINNRLKRRSFCCCCCCCCWMTRNDDGDNDDVCAAVTSTVNLSLTRTLIAHLSQYCVRITTTESRRCGDSAGHYTRDVSYSCIVL